MGLFTLIACGEDAYQEADKLVETEVENNSGSGITPPTTSPGYNSPFQPYSIGSFNVLTIFNNATPLHLELTPYGEDMHVQNFLVTQKPTYYPITNR